jgi:hypothetical protein
MQWVSNMGLLVFGLMTGTGIVFGASLRTQRGYTWADDVCSAASTLCASPGWLVVLTIVMALVYFYRISLNA